MRRILLIGKTGQLGKAIMAQAPSFGFEIISFNKEELNILNRFQTEEKLDRTNPSIIINTSAYHVVPQCEKQPLEALNVNFLAVQRLAQLCKERGIVFVTYSTDYVFDGEKGSPYEESDLPRPLQVYGFSKLAGECAALQLYPQGSFIIRTCGVFGGKEGSRQKEGNFVLNILKEAKIRDGLKVSSDQIANPTYAGDLGRATLRLLEKKANPGVYHLASEGYCSWYEFAKEILRLANINTRLVPVDRSGCVDVVARPKFSVLGNKRAKAVDVELPNWREGLESYFKFLNDKS